MSFRTRYSSKLAPVLMGMVCFAVISLADLVNPVAHADEWQEYDPQSAVGAVDIPLFVILAYSAVWLVTLAFVVATWRRQARVHAQMNELQQRLSDLKLQSDATSGDLTK